MFSLAVYFICGVLKSYVYFNLVECLDLWKMKCTVMLQKGSEQNEDYSPDIEI